MSAPRPPSASASAARGAWAEEMAIICQKVENPGLAHRGPDGLDAWSRGSMSMVCSRPSSRAVSIPAHIQVWGIDLCIQHSVGGADYGSGDRRVWEEGINTKGTGEGKVCLTEMAPNDFDGVYEKMLPDSMKGSAFLREYFAEDTVTTVDPRIYAVRHPSKHFVYEHSASTGELRAADGLADDAAWRAQVNPHQQRLWFRSSRHGPVGRWSRMTNGGTALYGAKITGGGSGGIVYAGDNSEQAAEAVRRLSAVRSSGRTTSAAPRQAQLTSGSCG